MTSLKTSIKTITYLSDIGCLEIQGASLAGVFIYLQKGISIMSEITASRPEVVNGDIICSTSVSHILAVQKSTQLQIDTLIRHQVSDIS